MTRKPRSLFPKRERTDAGKKLQWESEYEFLQRSSMIESFRVRKLLNDWFSRLKNGREDFLGRFQSRELGNFDSAFFELYLNELCICLGYSVSRHAETAEGNPDLLVRAEDGFEFYIEAVGPIGMPLQKHQSNSRRREILDRIDKLNSPDFFLTVHSQHSLSSSYSRKELRRELRRLQGWINSLDYDLIVTQHDQKRRTPSFRLKVENLTMHIGLLPKRSLRGRRDIGALGPHGHGEREPKENWLLAAIASG